MGTFHDANDLDFLNSKKKNCIISIKRVLYHCIKTGHDLSDQTSLLLLTMHKQYVNVFYVWLKHLFSF